MLFHFYQYSNFFTKTGRYGREHEFVRDREVVLRGAPTARDYPEERDYYAAARVRPEIDPRALALEDRRAYDESAYDRFQSKCMAFYK